MPNKRITKIDFQPITTEALERLERLSGLKKLDASDMELIKAKLTLEKYHFEHLRKSLDSNGIKNELKVQLDKIITDIESSIKICDV